MADHATLARMFRDIDARDADAFVRWLTDDVVFQYGNWPAAEGRDATREVVAQFFAGIAGLAHELTGFWECGDVTVCRLSVTYTRQDGRRLTLPAANILRYRGEQICDYRIYIDSSPLFA